MPDDTNVHGEDTVTFLKRVRRHIPGPMTILWDRGNVHDRSKVVRAYLAKHPEVVTEKFPSYTPEANPDESVWGHAEHGRLANFAPENTAELRAARHSRGIRAVASAARPAGGVHPACRDPDQDENIVSLATLGSVT